MNRNYLSHCKLSPTSGFTVAPRLAIVFLLIISTLQGCAQVSLQGQKGGRSQQVSSGQPQGGGQQSVGFDGPAMAGYWKFTYAIGQKRRTSSVRITQQGPQFEGSGTDDESNTPFNIEQGKMTSQGEIRFFKKYTSGKGPPIEYTGKVRTVDANGYKGPYMEGEFVTALNNNIVQGTWEAQMESPPDANAPSAAVMNAAQQQQQLASAPPPAQPPEQPPANVDPSKPPHLSGKWNTGYVYHGKTIQGKMYLEQEGGKLWGHGQDENTKEKFTIKGWYNFPKVTIVRNYTKGKGAAKTKEIRFTAKVQMVSDADYQGPYLEGETTLGELWQAQLYR
ncbi:MAG TPA: hypothetical protein V6D17_15005 [Candidatus Obscuribacterales bacterium]